MNNNKLEDFRLLVHDERSLLLDALDVLFTRRPESDTPKARALRLRLSRTECQPGGCPYCNADRAREDDEVREFIFSERGLKRLPME